jgi:hypothetical protein
MRFLNFGDYDYGGFTVTVDYDYGDDDYGITMTELR